MEWSACPCCAMLTLEEQLSGTWLICPVCGWADDPVQFEDIDYIGGANIVSLRQARQFYTAIGVSSPEVLRKRKAMDPSRLPS